jgi:hypothetical protein
MLNRSFVVALQSAAAKKEALRAAHYKIKELEANNRESENTVQVLRRINQDLRKELDMHTGFGADVRLKQALRTEELEVRRSEDCLTLLIRQHRFWRASLMATGVSNKGRASSD